MTDRLTMQDPRTQYPQPPFPEQPQPVPGSTAKMDPVPDHGETSYKGSGRLAGRKRAGRWFVSGKALAVFSRQEPVRRARGSHAR